MAVTGIVIAVLGAPALDGQDTTAGAGAGAPGDTIAPDTAALDTLVDAGRSVEEATGTIRELWLGFQNILPKIAIAIGLLVLAAVLSRLIRATLRRLLRNYSRAEAMSALAGIGVWVLAVGIALSVLAGDVRTLIGSIGLIGLALSWALQTPIESFTGWLLNSFRSYYRVGDRIQVGDVFGDVYRIDFLTTTVWEAGGPDKPVQGEQPTGALITFPNAEVLRANVTNYTRDFPYVWDEVTIGVTNGTDLSHAVRVAESVAKRTVGDLMRVHAREYVALLTRARLDYEISSEPQVFVAPTDSWMNLTIRYVIPARERRRWSTALHLAIAEEFARPEHAGRIGTSYPRTDVRLLDASAQPRPAPEPGT